MAPLGQCSIDREWAESLVGLRLKVPGSWWHGEQNKKKLFPCKVAQVDFSQTQRRYFRVEVLEELGTLYSFRYDAIAGYVDTEHDTFKDFQVPAEEVPDPENERASVRRRSARRSGSEEDASSEEDAEDEGEIEEEEAPNVYIRTEPKDWVMYKNNETGYRTIDPLPYTGDNLEATVNVSSD
jgi:hypothetical protein